MSLSNLGCVAFQKGVMSLAAIEANPVWGNMLFEGNIPSFLEGAFHEVFKIIFQ